MKEKYIKIWINNNGKLFIRCKNVSINEIQLAKKEFLLKEKK